MRASRFGFLCTLPSASAVIAFLVMPYSERASSLPIKSGGHVAAFACFSQWGGHAGDPYSIVVGA